MKTLFSTIFLSFALSLAVFAQNELVLEGTYQGENLFVQNPFSASGVGFCVADVTVNGEQSIDEINSSAFEIDFTSYQLFRGQSVKVVITYKDGCKPNVLNAEVLKASSTFVVTASSVSKDGTLTWETKDESGSLPYVIEQFRWNKWIKIGEVKGKGLAGPNKYSFKTKPHSGPNKFRLKQVDFTRKARLSKVIKLIRSSTPEVMITTADLSKVKTTIDFGTPTGAATETMYEVVTDAAVLVKKGFGSTIDVSTLKKGNYYLFYDTKMVAFTKK